MGLDQVWTEINAHRSMTRISQTTTIQVVAPGQTLVRSNDLLYDHVYI